MKSKIKYIIFIIVIVGVIFSLLYTKKKNDNFNDKTNVNISFNNPTTEVSNENSSTQEYSSSATNEPTSELSTTVEEVSTTSSEITEASSDLIVLTDDNFKDTIIKLATLDSNNTSNLDKLPITDSYRNELKRKQNMIDGVDSSTSINFQMGGISEDNTYMAQFRVGNIVYIVTGNISNNQIWSFNYRKM